jgi:CBS domain-containing protein
LSVRSHRAALLSSVSSGRRLGSDAGREAAHGIRGVGGSCRLAGVVAARSATTRAAQAWTEVTVPGPVTRRSRALRAVGTYPAGSLGRTVLTVDTTRIPSEVSTVKVKSIYRSRVVAADADEPLATAATRMRENQVGSLVVLDGEHLDGILTERDLTRAIAEGVDLETMRVADYMAEWPVAVSPDMDVREAVAAMLELECRHLPVVADGLVVGMVSIRDLLGTAIRVA